MNKKLKKVISRFFWWMSEAPLKRQRTGCLIFPSSKDETTPTNDPILKDLTQEEDLVSEVDTDSAPDLTLLVAAAIIDLRDAFIETRDMLRSDLWEAEQEPLPLSAVSSGLISSPMSSKLVAMPTGISQSTQIKQTPSCTASTPLTVSSLVRRLTRPTTNVSPNCTGTSSLMQTKSI